MNHFQSRQKISSQYLKTFYCKSSVEVNSLKSRNLIKNRFLPKFQIISQKFNIVTVSITYYPNNGIEQILNLLINQNSFHTHILKIFNAYFLISNLFGKFELTNEKFKADKHGNIALWLRNDYQQSLPILAKKTQINSGQYKKKFQDFLQWIHLTLKDRFVQNSLQPKLLEFNRKFSQVKRSLQCKDLNIQSDLFIQQILKYRSQFQNMKPKNARIQKTFLIPQFHPFRQISSKDQNLSIKQSKNQSYKRFSYDLQKKFNPKEFKGHFKNRLSCTEDFNKICIQRNNVEKKHQVKKQVKVPKFIKQKQLSKSEQIPLLNNKFSPLQKKINHFVRHKRIRTEYQINKFKETSLDYLQQQQSFQIYEFQNMKQNQICSKTFMQNKNIQNLSEKSIIDQKNEFKKTQSSLSMFSQKSTKSKKFFVPKLSFKQEMRIQEDLLELFSSRNWVIRDNNLNYDNEELANQFLAILL